MPQINKARYVIVRVDDSLMCPSHYENIKNDFVCNYKAKCYDGYGQQLKSPLGCEKCKYGDTKTQLIDKITTVINREMLNTNDFVILGGNKPFAKILSHKQLAQKIVEFLGIKEQEE